jgi:arsenical pump membrane protein
MWLPTLVSVVLTVVLLGLRYHRDLRGRYEVPTHPGVDDRWVFVLTAIACLGLVPGIMLGGDPTLVVTIASVALVVVFAVRRRAALRLGLVPWRLTLFVLGPAGHWPRCCGANDAGPAASRCPPASSPTWGCSACPSCCWPPRWRCR